MKQPKIIVAYWEEQKFNLSKDYIDSVKKLLIAEILMMRKVHKETPKCWFCGVAEVGNLTNNKGLQFTFGSRQDKSWIKKLGQIYVEVPFTERKKYSKDYYKKLYD